MTLLPQSMINEVEALLKARLLEVREDMFPLDRLQEITEWSGPISPKLRVRALLALHTVNSSAAFSDACAEAIVAADDWQDLLRELLNASRVGPQLVATACKVLRHRAPEHALAAVDCADLRVRRVCDAIDDGTELRVAAAGWSGLGPGTCWLLGLADPIGQCVQAVVSVDGSTIVITPETADWLERNRLACPAFLMITL